MSIQIQVNKNSSRLSFLSSKDDLLIYPGSIITVKIIGVLLTTDEEGDDEKVRPLPAPRRVVGRRRQLCGLEGALGETAPQVNDARRGISRRVVAVLNKDKELLRRVPRDVQTHRYGQILQA